VQESGPIYSSYDDPLGDNKEDVRDFVFDESNPEHMLMFYGDVMDVDVWWPMRPVKPKGLARFLEPEPPMEARGLKGVTEAHFEPNDIYRRFGHYRYSHMDPLLADREDHASVYEPAPHQLDTVEGWFEALYLKEDSRMRQNPRFLRLLQQMTDQRMYTHEDKEKFADALRHGLNQQPEYAGIEPFESELEDLPPRFGQGPERKQLGHAWRKQLQK